MKLSKSRVEEMLDLAASVACIEKHVLRSNKHGAAAIRSDGALVRSSNGASHGTTRIPYGHAEARLVRKLDAGSTVFVARVHRLAPGLWGWGNSKPCGTCEVLMRSRGVERVYYTIAPGAWEIIDL